MELKNILLTFLSILILGNLIFLDLKAFKTEPPTPTIGPTEVPATLPISDFIATPSGGVSCGTECQSFINVRIANLKSDLLKSLGTSTKVNNQIIPPSPTHSPSTS